MRGKRLLQEKIIQIFVVFLLLPTVYCSENTNNILTSENGVE